MFGGQNRSMPNAGLSSMTSSIGRTQGSVQSLPWNLKNLIPQNTNIPKAWSQEAILAAGAPTQMLVDQVALKQTNYHDRGMGPQPMDKGLSLFLEHESSFRT
jgi:hypothetical protein